MEEKNKNKNQPFWRLLTQRRDTAPVPTACSDHCRKSISLPHNSRVYKLIKHYTCFFVVVVVLLFFLFFVSVLNISHLNFTLCDKVPGPWLHQERWISAPWWLQTSQWWTVPGKVMETWKKHSQNGSELAVNKFKSEITKAGRKGTTPNCGASSGGLWTCRRAAE